MVRAKAVDKGNDVHGSTADEPESAKERREEADSSAKEVGVISRYNHLTNVAIT